MSKIIDLTGRRVGRLIVVSFAFIKNQKRYYLCKCDCGNEKTIRACHLSSKKTKSCGCLSSDIKAERSKNGKKKLKEYAVWIAIKSRCFNNKNKRFKNYAIRGITISEEFKNNFSAFYKYITSLPNYDKENTGNNGIKLTLDRIDNDKNYERGNLRWATQKQQANNKTNNHILTYNGLRLTVKEWSEKLNLNEATLRMRIKHGWSIEKTLTTPKMINQFKFKK